MAGRDFLTERLDALRAAGNLRRLPGNPAGIDFWSNDYLGFSRLLGRGHASELVHTAPGSRLISGDHPAISGLEADIAAFHGFPAALLFGSGYSANLGLLSCLARRTDTIVYDELIHASLRDGIRLSGAAARRCPHNSLVQAARILTAARGDGQTFFVTESRFSMDGDRAPLAELADLCHHHGAHLIVDEAHAIGLDGPSGAGLVAQLGLAGAVFATVVTYGKAPGYHGAAVLGSNDLRDYLINFSRPFIFTTAPRPAYVTGLREVYDLMGTQQPELRQQLQRVIEGYRSLATEHLGELAAPNDGPIQLVHLPGNERVMALEGHLRERGLLVKAIRSPSVPPGTERLRICLHAFNSVGEVEQLIDGLTTGLAKISA
ncbi:8-amino-7-oxononanoate synthase [Lewinella marina]|uniref:aminotransferase class I/II-fold pyridoxal phosphate-dependent enzyme n=1 Tax=Neolewinella marina TaxID=438751 RepID=UPI00142F8300|nr:8-amino-7-oxononanoate synthase [Neolewinella marina]NJB85474.1 8-amino-7-oxononanoate synthase [Neolewinella marina]